MPKTLEEYISLPYTIVLRKDVRDGVFVARVEELHGCTAHGDTELDALSNLRDNMRVWISDALEAGDTVPEPAEETALPSGKWLQRVPRSLHLKLIRIAKEEGVSLNQLVTAALAETVGNKAPQVEALGHATGQVYWIYKNAFEPYSSRSTCWYNLDESVKSHPLLSTTGEAFIRHLVGEVHCGRPQKEVISHARDEKTNFEV